MMKINVTKESFRSPLAVFIIYFAVSALLIMGFRFIFPGEAPPIPVFSRHWRLIRGALDFFNLFPALTFSALVAPFGMVSFEENHPGFSSRFFKRLVMPIVITICAAAAYCAVFFLIHPLLREYEGNMRFKGELYRLAKERARTHGAAGDWLEASQFIGICDGVWPDSPELLSLRTEINIHLDESHFDEEDGRAAARAALDINRRGASDSSLPGQTQPSNASEAIAMGETAYNKARYFDAHWLASLAGRLARPGSPEAASAARLEGRAWNQIESLAPSRREEHLFSLYNLKRSGYEAMNSGDWIRAYYIFQELLALTPDDPDAANFFTASEKGTRETAFFIDEMGLSLGEILTGAVFSLPAVIGDTFPGSRGVLRFSSLSSSSDYAYGTDLEFMSFDGQSRPLVSLRAPYAKLLPITLDGKPQVLVLMRALDRHDKNRRWEPEWLLGGGPAANAQLVLDLSFEDFLLLSRIRQGLPNLQIDELFAASKVLGAAGYVPEVFQAELLNRLGTALFFLPMAITALIIGWRYRVKNRSRYFFVLLLPVLPVVFNGLAFLYRTALNTLGIWLILALGFPIALGIFIAAMAVSFFVSLIILAAQHS
jgi:hypothetical protein